MDSLAPRRFAGPARASEALQADLAAASGLQVELLDGELRAQIEAATRDSPR